MPEVLIVGGGVIGCATAYYLARSGAAVTVIERSQPGSEASGAAAGMLAALSDEGGDRGPAFQQLCLESLALYRTLIPELDKTGVDLRYRTDGVLHLAMTEHEAAALRERFETQKDLAPENRWLEGAELFAEEPEANRKAVAGLISPGEHFLDPKRLVAALVEAGKSLGVRFRTQTDVMDLEVNEDSIAGITTPTGTLRGVDSILLAGGSWTGRLSSAAGVTIPVRPVKGQMISLRGPSRPLRRVIWGEGAYLVPREDGQTFAGATVEEAGYDKTNTEEAVEGLRRGASEIIPGLAGAEEVSRWAGLRPATPDGLPILGRLPGIDNGWVATGHYRNGILLAPITGKLMAEAILGGEMPAGLEAFSPSRFGLPD